jgi:hypothetical protein
MPAPLQGLVSRRGVSVPRLAAMLLAASTLSCEVCPDGKPTALDAWLECDDCLDEQRDSVAQLGASAVPVLTAILRTGPSAARQAEVKEQLGRHYGDLKSYRATHPDIGSLPDSQAFVARYLDAYVKGYRARAALALVVLNIPAGDRALKAAQEDSAVRGYVLDAVRCARDTACFR